MAGHRSRRLRPGASQRTNVPSDVANAPNRLRRGSFTNDPALARNTGYYSGYLQLRREPLWNAWQGPG
ncbi:hypothetical protein EMEDMD4_1030016 [Sinorhizobium medicae]|uniref:Uncharacterized protein n=1 Tax=Sinorhizobium medicae TaxID=110321 RepID=A0A508WR59_9HYPH|nr:hypothetical protein EMEDMD4_1030016 [Sinorhizobium medicae]